MGPSASREGTQLPVRQSACSYFALSRLMVANVPGWKAASYAGDDETSSVRIDQENAWPGVSPRRLVAQTSMSIADHARFHNTALPFAGCINDI